MAYKLHLQSLTGPDSFKMALHHTLMKIGKVGVDVSILHSFSNIMCNSTHTIKTNHRKMTQNVGHKYSYPFIFLPPYLPIKLYLTFQNEREMSAHLCNVCQRFDTSFDFAHIFSHKLKQYTFPNQLCQVYFQSFIKLSFNKSHHIHSKIHYAAL